MALNLLIITSIGALISVFILQEDNWSDYVLDYVKNLKFKKEYIIICILLKFSAGFLL
jgi:hypothetical protein